MRKKIEQVLSERLSFRPFGTEYGQDCTTGAHFTRVEARPDEAAGHHHYYKVCQRCAHEVKCYCATCSYRQSQEAADDLKYFKRKGARAI